MLASLRLALFTLALLPGFVSGVRHYDIVNNCPLPIDVYINGQNEGTLSSGGGSLARDYPDGWSGFIYSDFNRGNADGAGTVRAGFYGTNDYYYIVQDPNWLNVGVSIHPIDRAPRGGFCFTVECLVFDCQNSFTSPPTAFPPPTSAPPQTPLYSCPALNTGYRVTFCPDGTIPNYQTGPNTIHNVRSSEKCVDVQGGVFANGTPVQIYDCNGTQAQKWVIKRGGQQIKVSGTTYCLDAGSNPASGVGMKIWQCFDNLPAQQWIYTSDNTIRLASTNQCLDLTGGSLANGNPIQTWECAQLQNDNQVWRI
ncbi:hypothetical protein FA15DRAFT_671682 [Coprinopsis marcescibilis]|uniref:Ricin B lectin domain-containing protein n=1 Tax=Coprinopsis marcescibilis TaxID=230819 RepID=A0A5C3KP96_COPMA|nr:hypothetical protein FA15DRAFT_671682 [Coprinopsis marcescibilis]